MNNNLIQIVFVIDKSGSMRWLTDETVSGFNSFVDKYRQEDVDAILTTVLFDDYLIWLHDGLDIQEVPALTRETYQGACMGCTALYDAIGVTIKHVGERLASMPEEDRPGKVLFVITTDGYENASNSYNKASVREMIEHQTNKYSWDFIFLGANIDSEETAQNFGIDTRNAVNYGFCPQGVEDVYNTVYTVASNQMKGVSVSATMDSLKGDDGFIKSENVSDSKTAVNSGEYAPWKDDWTQLEDGRWVML